MNSLYERLATGEWIGSVVEFASEDYESIRRILLFCENEFAENPEFAKTFAASKSFRVLCESLMTGRFSNSNEVLLFWARLVSGGRQQEKKPDAQSPPVSPTLPVRKLSTDRKFEIGLRSSLKSIVSAPGFGTGSAIDPSFGTAIYEAVHLVIRENITRAEETGVNEELIRFLWLCAKNSSSLTKIWTTPACLKILVKSVFVYEMFTHSASSLTTPNSRLRRVMSSPESSSPTTELMELLLDLIAWAVDPAEAYRVTASSFPDEVLCERVAEFENKLFLGILPHASNNSFLASAIVQRSALGWHPQYLYESLSLALETKGLTQKEVRTLVLCALDRSEQDDKILKYLENQLTFLLTPPDADLFVACLVHCVFNSALNQAMMANMKENNGEEDLQSNFKSWSFFINICRTSPDSVKKLISSPDELLNSQLIPAISSIWKETQMDWLPNYGSTLRQVINQNALSIWSKEMENKNGRWYLAGRVPLTSSDGTIQMLYEMTKNASNEKSSARVRGWTTPRERTDTFFNTEEARVELATKARSIAFQKQEQLFFAKFEDLLRGKKSWGAILRRAQLPTSAWEPFGGRNLEIEELHQRWKLDPFEDPSRARRRLRLNRTFYKRYNLVKVQSTVVKRESSSSVVSLPSSADEKYADKEGKTSPWGRPKRKLSDNLGTSPKLNNAEFDPQSPNVIKALRKLKPADRIRTHTLVTASSSEVVDEEIHLPPLRDDEDGSTLGSDNEEDGLYEDDDSFSINKESINEEKPSVSKEEEEDEEMTTENSERPLDESPIRRHKKTLEDIPTFFEDMKTNEEDFVVVDIGRRVHRERVKAEMDPQDRDSVSFKINCSTVRGLEERRGLCLITRSSLYVIDNYEVVEDGSIIEIEEKNANFNVQVRQEDESMLMKDDKQIAPRPDLKAKQVQHRRRRVRYDDITDPIYRRRFLFRDVGLEIFSGDGSTLLIVLTTKMERDKLLSELKKARKRAIVDLPFPKASEPPPLTLNEAQKRWKNGVISNFDYLTLLNTIAGRSYNDPAQYLVFPWVLSDYESQRLNLDDSASFRNLSKPMGALTLERENYAKERYALLETEAEAKQCPPFHFGTHYSCSGYVANFLFRLEPYSRMALQLQGGAFDRPDRLFRSVEATWKSASGLNLNMQDVRELVPEFYCMHEFLENRNRFELGVTQKGATVGDVELPPWAIQSPAEFIRLHRKALESKYVSEHLNEWIDLIFGYRQRGREAIKALNVFHPLTYEGEVDLDSMTDPAEREATMEQIHSFGQTPTKLFENQPHPRREVPSIEQNIVWHSALAPALVVPGSRDRPHSPAVVSNYLYDGENTIFRAGEVSLVAVDDLPGLGMNVDVTFVHGSAINSRIVEILLDDAEKPFALKANLKACFIGSNPSRYVLYGDVDGSLEIRTTSQAGPLSMEIVDKTLVSFEDLHHSKINCVACLDEGKLLITGGSDGVLSIWRLRKIREVYRLDQEAANVGHQPGSAITCLAVSKEQGIVVSGSDDCTAALWDLGRRQEYVRSLRGHSKPLRFVSVNNANGNIMTVCEKEIRFWHVNGELIAKADLKAHDLQYPTCAICTPCQSHQPGIVAVVGHSNGDISLWDLLYPSDESAVVREGNEILLQLRAILRHGTKSVIALTLSRDKRMFASADSNGEVKRWVSAEVLKSKFKNLFGGGSGITSIPGHIAGVISRNSSTAPTTKTSGVVSNQASSDVSSMKSSSTVEKTPVVDKNPVLFD